MYVCMYRWWTLLNINITPLRWIKTVLAVFAVLEYMDIFETDMFETYGWYQGVVIKVLNMFETYGW